MTTPEATIEAVPAGSQPIGLSCQCRQRCSWKFDLDAVREAAAALELRWPILLEKTDGYRTIGAHRTKRGRVVGHDGDTYHGITVSRLLAPEQASRTLWHELEHARQAETIEHFDTRYRNGEKWRFEAEAEERSEWHEALPLTTPRSRAAKSAAAQAGSTPEREAEIEAAGERLRQRDRARADQELVPATR